jgi:isocitrate dehydrogenase
MQSSGGFIWAAKNYDGDVGSDFIAQGMMCACLYHIVLCPMCYI